ncbi:MAG TPA: DUF1566 domain-containing protein [bacterium]|nr:DUF1566 domain-containing protein [bacterium]
MPGEAAVVWTDAQSGLTWQVEPTGYRLTQEKAKAHCEALILSGNDDWRLPSLSELRSLVRGCPDAETGGSCAATDQCLQIHCWKQSCGGCPRFKGPGADGRYWPAELTGETGIYWSSSTIVENRLYAVYVDFYSGLTGYSLNVSERAARCVRGGR